MSDPKSRNIPKFASFRPKPAPQAIEDIQVEPTRVKEKGSHRKGKHNDRNRDENDHAKLSRPTPRSKQEHGSLVDLPKSEALEPNEIQDYVIDRLGDVNNIRYGSMHKYSVPKFHRYGSGFVIGVSPRLRIDHNIVDDKEVILLDPSNHRSVLREKYTFSKIWKLKPRLLKIRDEPPMEAGNSSDDNYISLESRYKKKSKRNAATIEQSSGSEHEDRDYRSIDSKVHKKDVPLDSDLQFATESESSGSENARTLDSKSWVIFLNTQLSRRVEEVPNDVEAWLALINHQEQLIRGGDDRHRITTAEVKSTAEIKIHMYEKAIRSATTLEDREILLVGLMNEGSKIWETKAQADRWEQVSKDNINSFALWVHYLNFKQSRFSIFRFEETKDIYHQRIKFLLQVSATSIPAEDLERLHEQLLYVILRLTIFLRESGYMEFAIAIWQSLLEINFCGPKKPISVKQSLTKFKDFWESEVPRIGENGALGWHRYVEDPSDAPNPQIDKPHASFKSDNIFMNWSATERLRSADSKYPARAMDEVIEDDPFRVILFSDIESFLLTLPSTSEYLRRLCIEAMLLFCHLPPMSLSDRSNFPNWRDDPFVRGELLENHAEYILAKPVIHEQEKEMEKASIPLVPCSNIKFSSEALFNDLVRIEPYRTQFQNNAASPPYQWIRNCLRQLSMTWSDDFLTEYYLSFEFRNEPESIKKAAKTLLKKYTTSFRLYHAYGMIELCRGNKDVAYGVFSSALHMGKSIVKTESDFGLMALWRSWIWALLKDGDKKSALGLINCIPSGTPAVSVEATPASLLRAKQYFKSNRDYLLSIEEVNHSALHAEFLALLEYLSIRDHFRKEIYSNNQGEIICALAVFTSFSRKLQEKGFSQSNELFLQSAARLLRHHACAGTFRPALIREHATEFLAIFPRNTIFLELYRWNESRLRIDNRVRNIFFTTILSPKHDSITSRLFAILYEVHYGTIHSVKSAFEHALSSPAAESSAGLWRLYILYSLQIPQFQTQTKEIWLRALRACPWAKELYITGFEKLNKTVGFEDLKSTWRVMGEKGLRIHVDLEDHFEELAELDPSTTSHRRVNRQ